MIRTSLLVLPLAGLLVLFPGCGGGGSTTPDGAGGKDAASSPDGDTTADAGSDTSATTDTSPEVAVTADASPDATASDATASDATSVADTSNSDATAVTEAGSDSTPATPDGGTVQWDGVAKFGPAFSSPDKSSLNLVLGNYAGVCALVTAGKDKANSRGVHFEIERSNATKMPMWVPVNWVGGPTPIPVDANGDSVKMEIKNAGIRDANCVATSAGKPNGAILNITSITATEVKGTFMVTFEAAPSIGGPFVATTCPERPEDAGAKTCAP